MQEISAVILSAGKSKRMKTKTSKVLHPLMGKALIDYVLSACEKAGVKEKILVVGHEQEKVRAYLGDRVKYAEQNQQMGTGHAVLQAMPLLKDFNGLVLVICGDMPLISHETLADLIESHIRSGARISLLTAIMEDPGRLGRIIRDEEGFISAIVEAVDATDSQLKIREVNTGTYIFDSEYLERILPAIGMPNAQGEIYLTDTIALSVKKGVKVNGLACADWKESLGINSRVDMAVAVKAIRERINERLMLSGVTLYDPDNTYIEESVVIGNDTTILPGCMITGDTIIGCDCTIGPNTRIENSRIGENTRIRESVICNSEIGAGNEIGPFAHVRPDTVTGESVRLGNFVETKKSTVGDNTKVSHLSYVGDTTLGRNVNVGAGTITCNYDGIRKNPTVIKDGAFIGSNTSLIAPVVVGEGSMTGASSVVRRDVPDRTLAVGHPARNIRKLSK